ncbi:MAG: hypothetical protein ACP5RS_07370, partial [Thermoplasmata archaeon]
MSTPPPIFEAKEPSNIPDIEKMENEKDIAGLVRALTHPNSYVRWNAAYALGKIAKGGEAKAVVNAG